MNFIRVNAKSTAFSMVFLDHKNVLPICLSSYKRIALSPRFVPRTRHEKFQLRNWRGFFLSLT